MLLGEGKGEVTGDKDSYTPAYTHVVRGGEGGGDWGQGWEGKGEVTGDKDSYTPAYTHVVRGGEGGGDWGQG